MSTPEEFAKVDIACYALPYGGLGFLSDLITLWTIVMRRHGMRPWLPLLTISGGMLDIALGVLTIVGTMGATVYTIVRCRHDWHFVLIAAWKMMLSMMMGLMTIHAAWLVNKPDRKSSEVGRWMMFYSLGLLVGLVGLADLAVHYPHGSTVRNLGIVLLVAPVIYVPVTYIFVLSNSGDVLSTRECCQPVTLIYAQDPILSSNYAPCPQLAYSFAVTYGFTTLLLGNWVLGAIADNYGGVPSHGNVVIFAIYFVCKRLPFLTT